MWKTIWNRLFRTKSIDVIDSFDSPYRAPGEKDDWIAPPPPAIKKSKPNAFIEWLKRVKQFLMDNLFEIVFTTVIVAALSFGGWLIFKAANAPDTFTHCYIVHSGSDELPFYLKGALEMSDDTIIGRFEHINFAIEAAENINCPLK